MGRRIKQPRSVHRETIAAAASALFMKAGIAAVSMDEIAAAAGYSKATLYVYFQNKEGIVGLLVLESMKKLYACICAALEEERGAWEQYLRICRALAQYQTDFPFYFQMALERINIDFNGEHLPEDEETYQIGERINEKLNDFVRSGMERGELRQDLEPRAAVFQLWGMLAGLIQLADSKEPYIQAAMGLTREQFLESGFALLGRALKGRDV